MPASRLSRSYSVAPMQSPAAVMASRLLVRPSRSNSSPVVFTASFFCSVAMMLPRREPFSALPSYSSSESIIDPSRLALRPSRKSADT